LTLNRMQIMRPWDELRTVYERVTASLERPYATSAHAVCDRRFVAERFTEGQAVGRLIAERLGTGRRLRILDVGTGLAGVALGVANVAGNEVVALDRALHVPTRTLVEASGLALDYVVASAAALPLPSDFFDVVLYLETLEHMPEPEAVGAEIMRVLKPGGLCILTTPARLRFLFRRDPHFAIPGLLLLPDAVQKWLATSVLRVVPRAEYDVAHTYWYAGNIARLFPAREAFQAIGAPPDGLLARRVWSFFKRFTWDRCIVTKRMST
jgi:ubiquinone/menaquinone biosynthesis C-methylase UbiE